VFVNVIDHAVDCVCIYFVLMKIVSRPHMFCST